MTTHIVCPIGVAAPGTPLPHLLRTSLDSILNQSSQDFILTVAADTNISDEAKEILKERNLNVKWHAPHSFFAPGGIWKKISDCWKEVNSKYIAFLHYDDKWDLDKLKIQVEKMENEKLSGSWSEVYVIGENDNVMSGDNANWEQFSSSSVGTKTLAFAHSVIVNREQFLSSGILKYEHKWSPNFEDIFAIYLHKIGNMKKAHGAKFYWRDHSMNMSNTLCKWHQPNSLWKDAVEEQMNSTGYPNDILSMDYHFILRDMAPEVRQIALKYV